MLTVDVRINGTLIAQAKAVNLSELADISDYQLEIWTAKSPITGEEAKHHTGRIEGHYRLQSVWALVGEMVKRALFLEKKDIKPDEKFENFFDELTVKSSVSLAMSKPAYLSKFAAYVTKKNDKLEKENAELKLKIDDLHKEVAWEKQKFKEWIHYLLPLAFPEDY